MANDKRFVVKNGLAASNVNLVDDIQNPVDELQLSLSSNGELIIGGSTDIWGDLTVNGSITFTGTLTGNVDADFLEGANGAFYLDFNNFDNIPDPVVTVELTGDVTGSANGTLTNLGNTTISVDTSLSVALTDLTDVTITTPASGQLVVYNGTSSQWENSGSVSLDDLGINLNGAITIAADDGSGVIQLKAPATVPDILQIFKLPGDDGVSGHVLTTDGSGNLSFSPPTGLSEDDERRFIAYATALGGW